MQKEGFVIPLVIIAVFLIVGITGGIILLKNKNSEESVPGPSPNSIVEEPGEDNKLVSPPPLSPSESPRYISDEPPDRVINVVAGGFNFINFTVDIKGLNNPTLAIEKGRQNWMYLQTKTPSKKTNVYYLDTFFHSTLAFAPPKNTSGKYDLVVNIYDNNQLEKQEIIRINILDKAQTVNFPLPPKNFKAVLIGVGYERSIQNKISELESAYLEATDHQGQMEIEYLGNVTSSNDDVFSNTNEIIDSYILNQGRSLSEFDLAIVYLKNYGGAPRTSSSLKKIAYCCQNITFIHEFLHMASGIGDIGYENTLFPPDPLHYSDFEITSKYSNPALLQLGFDKSNKGIWILVDEWGYKKIGNSQKYRVTVKNTGSNQETINLNTDNLNSSLNVKTVPPGWVSLNKTQITLEPEKEEIIELTIKNSAPQDGTLYGLTITATSQSDQSIWDKANIYFEK